MVRTELVLVFCLWGAVAVNSTDVRLVGRGSSPCSGRVEVFHGGQWGTVCDDLWDLSEATVVCRQLDCGSALQVKHTAHFGPGSGPQWLDDVECRGNESSLTQCKHAGFGQGNCLHLEDVGVICSDSVRLVSGRSSCSGSLQVRDQSLDQPWTWVCESDLDRAGAEVLCRELRCGPPLLQGALSPLGQTFHCEGNESALMDCPRNQTRTNPETCSRFNLTCSEPVRLVGGASRCEGSVEAELRGEWRRLVTFDLWDLECAAVVCRSLDCGSAVFTEERRGFNRSNVWWVRSKCVKASSVRVCASDSSTLCTDFGLHVLCSG